MSRRRGARGFTLVSVLLAVLMLTIGLVALARTQGLLTSAESTVSSRSVALALASTYVEQLRGRDPWTLVSEAPVAVDGEGVPAAAGLYRRSTVITLDQTNLVRVRVLVTYPRGPVPIELTTLIYRPPA
jgi:type II secretory pathway pseudopilin PulG